MAQDTNQKITHLLQDQIPDYVQDFYPLFVIFVTKYFEYLENSSSGVQTTIQNLQLNRDVDTTASSLAIKFLNNFVPNFPSASAVDDSILVKYFRQFYQLKGSEKSFKYFFRAFFNDEIEISYPRDYMFRPSDGNWYVENTFRVISDSGNPESLEHTWVTGTTTRANAVLNDVVKLVGQGATNYYDIILQSNTLRTGSTRIANNLSTFSEQLNNWSKTNVWTSSDVVLAPNGLVVAEKVVANSTSGTHGVASAGIPATSSTIYTVSIYAKAAESSTFSLRCSDPAFIGRAFFNLTSGTVSAIDANILSSTITLVGNGWYRCTASYRTSSIATTTFVQMQLTEGVNLNYAGDNTSGMYFWGGQLETGLIASDYIRTTATALTSQTITGFALGEPITGINYDFENNTTSLVSMYSLGTVATAPGRYLNSQSQLSNNQLLQDSFYYQQFSYVLKTHNDREVWADHVLKQLHPTGTKMFNDYLQDAEPDNLTSGFANTVVAETSVKIPNIKSYLVVRSAYTFDRGADLNTGTSTTRIATTTGFATVAYTSIGALSYSATYDYPGEHITWALQKLNDTSAVTEIIRFNGASFDKLTGTVGLDDQIIAWPLDVNSSLVVTRYAAVSSALTAGTFITSFSSNVLSYGTALANATSVGSLIVIFNNTKNTQGNHPNGESANAIVITFSSTASIIPYFGGETQRNYERIALNDSLNINNLIYYNSSNSIQTNLVSDSTLSSYTYTTSTGQIVFKPYNWERGATYDRLSIRFEIAPSEQLNTSLSQNFNTLNITSTGLIASYSSTLTSISVNSFINQTSNLILWSEQFETVAAWTTAQCTITSNIINSPTATLTADGLIETVALARHEISQAVATNISPDGIYTYSIYAQQALRSKLRITSTDNAESTFCIFDLSSLSTVVSGPVLNTELTSVGGSWYRCSFTRAVSTTAVSLTIFHHPYTTTSIYVGDATTSALYLWGAQLERKTRVNDYVQTTSAQITVNPQYAFSSNCFVFNGSTSDSRYIQTPEFPYTARLDVDLSYIVGDSYNGGELPDGTEDLELQYSLNTGSSWFTGAKLWTGSSSNTWTLGTSSQAGRVFVQAGSTTLTGIGTLFGTTLAIGDRLSINSGTTTAYTITSIINNNTLTVTPAFVDNQLGLTSAITGTVATTSAGTTVTGSGTTFLTRFVVGDKLTIGSSASTTTAYTITNIVSDTEMTVAPAPTATSSGLAYYGIAGELFYQRLPASRQFATTSISIYGPGPQTSVTLRIIQLSQTDLNNDVYAVENLNVRSYRYQDTTGVVNIGVAVSSNSTLNINDTDLFTITSIGSP